MESRTVRLGTLELRHLESGPDDAPSVVLVHGLTTSHRYWHANVRYLARRWHVLAPDLPGFGGSSKPDVDYSIDYFVDVLLRFLEAKRLREPVALIGNSMGGLVAMALALAHPDAVRRLVLVDPAGMMRLPHALVAPGLALADFYASHPTLPVPRLPSLLFHALFRTVFPGRPDLARRYVRSYERAVASDEYELLLRAAVRAMGGVLKRPIANRAPLIRAPTLIIWGARDRLLHVGGGHRLRRLIPGSRIVVYAESGHCPMVDQPSRWNRDVEAFLDGRPVGT